MGRHGAGAGVQATTEVHGGGMHSAVPPSSRPFLLPLPHALARTLTPSASTSTTATLAEPVKSDSSTREVNCWLPLFSSHTTVLAVGQALAPHCGGGGGRGPRGQRRRARVRFTSQPGHVLGRSGESKVPQPPTCGMKGTGLPERVRGTL
jgi:hypothetical protein